MTTLLVILAVWAATIVGTEALAQPWRHSETRADKVIDTALYALYGPWLFPYLVVRRIKGEATP